MLVLFSLLPVSLTARPEPVSAIQTGVKQTLRGTVYDDFGDPLPGVVVRVKGTDFATVTDADGRYSLGAQIKKGMSITFSFLGMKPVEIVWGGESKLDVTMKTDSKSLNEERT